MAKFAIMMDTSKCTGCRGCQLACKRWYELPYEETTLTDSWTNPPDLTPRTWMHVRLVENGEGDDLAWTFYRWTCLHCDEPPCAGVCPTRAITKFDEGPVVVDQSVCIGCRYCVQACPFGIPRRDSEAGVVYKCTMCADRISQGKIPNCVESCPTGALAFGEKSGILAKAKARASAINGYVYGEKEAGGTSYYIVTNRPLEELGLPKVGPEPISKWVLDQTQSSLGIGLPIAAALAAVYYVAERKGRLAKEARKNE